jgi:hypothetical protein
MTFVHECGCSQKNCPNRHITTPFNFHNAVSYKISNVYVIQSGKTLQQDEYRVRLCRLLGVFPGSSRTVVQVLLSICRWHFMCQGVKNNRSKSKNKM